MAYANFTQALMQAKRAAQLRGLPFSTSDVRNLQSGYMEGATERANAERSNTLSEKGIDVQERGLTAQQNALEAQKGNWAATLAQERELAGRSEEQARNIFGAQMEAQDAAARKQTYGNLIGTGVSLGGAYWLSRPPADTGLNEILLSMQENAAANSALTGGTAGMSTTTGLGTVGMETGANVSAGMGGAGEVSSLGASSTGGASLGGVASFMPYTYPALAGYAAPGLVNAVHGDSTENLGHNLSLGLIGDEKTAGAFGSAATGAAAGAAVGSVVPVVGTAVGAAVGAVTGFLSNVCIIVTACTDRNSPEVEITRAYRDKFLDADQLRGYYMIAERVVPIIKRHGFIKKTVKKWLVDRLVDYGAVALGQKATIALRSSWIVSRLFLLLIRLIGKTRKSYQRSNGEVF